MNYVFEDSISFLINRATVKIKREMSNRFNNYDITIEQWALLTRLWQNDGISQTELSRRSSKDLPTVTRMLLKMEKKGLISRRVDPDDSRSTLIFLTNEGKDLEDELDAIAYEIEVKALKNIKIDDVELLRDVLGRIIANMD